MIPNLEYQFIIVVTYDPHRLPTLAGPRHIETGTRVSQCLVMAYVTDTPSQRLDSYIILTLADVGQHPDSLLFHTSADGRPS